VKRPYDRFLVGDSGRPAGTPWTFLTWANVKVPPYDLSGNGTGNEMPAFRHNRQANVCFFDGHVEPANFNDMNQDRTKGLNRYFAKQAEIDTY
jgi:prepilin-type processing-associated H-X9-DG protein